MASFCGVTGISVGLGVMVGVALGLTVILGAAFRVVSISFGGVLVGGISDAVGDEVGDAVRTCCRLVAVGIDVSVAVCDGMVVWQAERK